MGDEDYFFIGRYEGSEAVANGGDVVVEVWGWWNGTHRWEVETDGGVSVRFEDSGDGGVDGGFMPGAGY